MRILGEIPVLLLAWTAISTAGTTAPSSTGSQYASISVCPSRTINYITETLPQQCLRTSWSSNATTVEARNDTFTSANEEGQEIGIQTWIVGQSNDTAPTSSSSASSSSPLTKSAEVANTTTVIPTTGDSAVPSVPEQAKEEESEQDVDPLSDNANFLSFEEWKAQMLKDAGQSPEHVAGVRKVEPGSESRRRPSANHDLDSLGDDTEISIDFTGFVNTESVHEALPPTNLGSGDQGRQNDAEMAKETINRRQEAGITSKERFNYASFDCAATILKTNEGCKGPTSILVENKDTYMLNKCSVDNKFLIVELCNDILIDTIALGNYEFFSSTFRTFRVSISDRYPVKQDKWRELGTFEAQNVRGVQAFMIQNGLIWARYLRIEFLSHYGSEYYCPVSLLRVHGKTMMDDYRNEVKNARGEDDIDDDIADAAGSNEDPAAEDVPAAMTTNDTSASSKEEDETISDATTAVEDQALAVTDHRMPSSFNDTCPRTNYPSPLIEQVELLTSGCNRTWRFCNLELTGTVIVSSRKIPLYSKEITSTSKPLVLANSNTETSNVLLEGKTSDEVQASTTSKSDRMATGPSKTETQQQPSDKRSASTSSGSNKQVEPASSSHSSSNAQSEAAGQGSSKTATQPPSSVPSTQESFFKSVHKRLQLLEANSTLSLQYIEEQSRILREAFTKVEKRQLSKTTTFLESLNVTVLSELREFRLQYDQIWQSTILELSSQREQSHREAVALSSRLAILADEVLWQKRLVYLQFGLIFICLVLIFLSRNPVNVSSNYLELPLLQNMMTRSSPTRLPRFHHHRSRSLADESPPDTPVSRPTSRYGLFGGGGGGGVARLVSHTRSTSEDTTKSPSSEYQPPTPPSEEDTSSSNNNNNHLLSVPDADTEIDGVTSPERESNSPEQADAVLRRAVSSPALGQDTSLPEDEEEDPEDAGEEKSAATIERSLNDRPPSPSPPSTRTVKIQEEDTNTLENP